MRPSLAAAILLLLVPVLLPSPAAALPTPGLFCEPAEMTTGRVFPEALHTNDFVSLDEAICGLRMLEEMAPERIEVVEIGRSFGWSDAMGAHATFPVLAVEITNEASAVAREDKVQLLFQLSIHGNEKDGREGGLRAIEDLARGIGMLERWPELEKHLDYELLIFTLPNPDGWVHEELEYRVADADNPFNFVRENGNGKDLNRQWPTVGWMRDRYTPFSEPEIEASYDYLRNFTNLRYATDIHGMLTPADGQFHRTPLDDLAGVGADSLLSGGPDSDEPRSHFLLTMVAAGRMDPDEWRRITALSEMIKGRVNEDPELAAWHTLPATGAWGGEANEWGMAVDAIGYEDAGFTGDFFTQDHGLNVPDIDFEMSYNHILFDNYYPGMGALVNHMATASVRQIVRSMMDMGALDVQVSVETHGTRTLVVENPVVLTNGGDLGVTGWAETNALDDAFDTAHRVYEAAPADYFHDLQPFLRDGEKPGVLDVVRGADVSAATLSAYDRVVVPGSAVDTLAPAAVDALRAWVGSGGRLFLTDSALQLLEPLGLADEGGVDVAYEYTGAVDIVDRAHPLVKDVRGLARQTYVAVPLGYGLESYSAPNWFVKAGAFDGDVVGLVERDPARVSLGAARLGAGEVGFLGAFLPDPTQESYHPYGLDSYSATYSANQILRNAMGWEEVYAEAPLEPERLGQARALREGAASGATDGGAPIPAPALGFVALALLGAAVLARRR